MTISNRNKAFIGAAAIAAVTLPVVPQITSGELSTYWSDGIVYVDNGPYLKQAEYVKKLAATIYSSSGESFRLDLSEQERAWNKARRATMSAESHERNSGIHSHATATVVTLHSPVAEAWAALQDVLLGEDDPDYSDNRVLAIFTGVETEEPAI